LIDTELSIWRISKPSLDKMASIKSSKIKNETPLLKTTFSRIETLSFSPKRFLHRTVVFWGSIIGLEISAHYHSFIILKLEKWMNSED